MLVRIIGVLPPEAMMPPGALIDLPDDEAFRLVDEGYAVALTDRELERYAMEAR